MIPPAWVSVDPGDRHVGWAEWEGRQCIKAVELTPEQAVERLEELTGIKYTSNYTRRIEVLVCEKFSLYAWNEKSLAGNEFLTSQLIGCIKYICNRGGVLYVGQLASQAKSLYRTNSFKHMTATEKRRMPWWGSGEHAKDAWAHGMYFIKERDRA